MHRKPKQLIISVITTVIVTAFLLEPILAQPPRRLRKFPARCPDGICDEKEKADPNLCPEDCKNIIETEPATSTIPTAPTASPPTVSNEDSPFGIMAAFDMSTLSTINASDKVRWAGTHFKNLGAKWSRAAGEKIFWGIIEPELEKGYNWSISDEVLKKVYQNAGSGFNMIVIVSSSRAKGTSSDIPSADEKYFKNFVKALVERYDGDGVNDYDPIIKVKYWQADNEPFPRHWEANGGTVEGYIRFAELLSSSVKEADPDAKIILGTFQLQTPKQVAQFNDVVSAMKNKNLFDYVDTHYLDSGNNYKIPVTKARNILNSNGYSYVKIMSLEYGTWVGRGSSEKDQAKYLIKGYVYNLANGVSMINWNNLVEWNNFGGNPRSIYNFMGLIADGQNGDTIPAGTGRLSYYAYKKMTETLEGSDWKNIQKIQENDGIYIYKFTKNNKPIWVAWNDNADSREVGISGIPSNQVKISEAVPRYELGKEIRDYNSAFNQETKTAKSGKILIKLEDIPVFIEEM